jgi:hypothetical protein
MVTGFLTISTSPSTIFPSELCNLIESMVFRDVGLEADEVRQCPYKEKRNMESKVTSSRCLLSQKPS